MAEQQPQPDPNQDPTNAQQPDAQQPDAQQPDASSGGSSPPQGDELEEALTGAQTAVNELSQEAGGQFDASAFAEVYGHAGIDMLGDVELHVSVELGRTEMLVEDVLRLAEGSVVELDKLAGDPVDVYVNQRLVARGEVLVLNDNFCIRISEIVDDLEQQAHEAAAGAAAQSVGRA